MADGYFDSSSSGGGYDYDDGYGSGGGGDTSLTAMVIMCTILGLIIWAVKSCEADRLEKERELDRTVHQAQAEKNLEAYINKRPWQWRNSIVRNSMWMEPGSSHRDHYHCKGVQFDTADGRSRTLCCNVKEPLNGEPLCLDLSESDL